MRPQTLRRPRRLALLAILVVIGSLFSFMAVSHAANEYDNPSQGLQPATPGDTVDYDSDGDGLPQSLEFSLARQFMPTIWFHRWEGCAEPAGNKNHSPNGMPGRLIFHAARNPASPEAITITYALLYARDCGAAYFFGVSGHHGDVEPFSITLIPNPDCQNGFGIYSVRTWAHEGTAAEHIDTDIHTGQCRWGFSRYSVNHNRSDGRIVVALAKHGNFLSPGACNVGFFVNNGCKTDWTAADISLWVGLNAGEKDVPLASHLGALDFPGEAVWAAKPFCGNVGNQSGCPGPIEAKFNLLAPAPGTPIGDGGGGGGGECHTRTACESRDTGAISNGSIAWRECAVSNFDQLTLEGDAVEQVGPLAECLAGAGNGDEPSTDAT